MDEMILARSAICYGVEPRAVFPLMEQAPPVDLPAGHVVFAEGEPGDRLYIIIRGKVKIGRRVADNHQIILSIMGPSDIFGELSIFDPGPRSCSATTITNVRAMSMDRHALQNWTGDHPQISEQLVRVFARRMRRTTSHLGDIVLADTAGRVARQLLRLAQRFGSQHDGALLVTHDLTQEELAQLVGASRRSVNRALAEFVSRGWLRLETKSVWILDSTQLALRAKHGPSISP